MTKVYVRSPVFVSNTIVRRQMEKAIIEARIVEYSRRLEKEDYEKIKRSLCDPPISTDEWSNYAKSAIN